MGYYVHHAIVCTSWNNEHIKIAHGKAREILGDLVSALVEAKINGFNSFFIAPDGSKEGWTESDDYDELRRVFVKWLRDGAGKNNPEGLWVDYCEISFGGDEPEQNTQIIDHNK